MDDGQLGSSKTAAEGKSRSLSPNSKCKQEREALRAIFKTWFDKFSEDLKAHTQVPAGEPLHTPFEIQEWPTELKAEHDKADQRLKDSNGVLASNRRLFGVFEQNLTDIKDPFRHWLVLLRMVQDELNGVPGADVNILQDNNQELVTEMIRASLGRDRVATVVLYDDIADCEICYEKLIQGSDAVTMPCPLKHTYCMGDAIDHLVTYPQLRPRCPKCGFGLPPFNDWVPLEYRSLLSGT